METFRSPTYRNLISHIDINRSVNSIENFKFANMYRDPKFSEFLEDINSLNDSIELNLIKNNAYKEAVVMSLNISDFDKSTLLGMIKDEQKTFGGSKLFYLSDNFDKILIIAVPKSLEGKFKMVIGRLNKVNEKINRINSKTKKGNLDIYVRRKSINDKKETMINLINKNLKV